MRLWLKTFLGMMAVVLGASTLWLWAAPLTGPDGRNVVFTETDTIDAPRVKGNLLHLHNQTVDPTPVAGDLILYNKAGALHTREPGGNVVNIHALGGGGGGGGVGLTARLITTANITRSGEQTLEGILTSGSRVFVIGQSVQTENGIFLTAGGPWTRVPDAATGAAFSTGTLVTISDGIAGPTGNKGTTWMYTSAGSYNTSALTAIKTGLGPTGELASNKNIASGYAGLTSEVKHIWTQNGDADTHTAVAAASQITPTASTMRIAGVGPVTMTSGNPRITGCTTAAMDGVEVTIEGSHATDTVTMPNGNGVLLCGNTGSKVFGLNRGSTRFICNFSTLTWREANCPSLQDTAHVGKDLFGAADLASAVRIGTDVNTHCRLYGKTIDCIEGGAATDSIVQLAPGTNHLVKNSGGVTLFGVAEATGTITGPVRGTVVTSLPLRRATVNFGNANVFVSPQNRTNYGTNVLEYVETGTGCAYFETDIPANLAASPQWGLQIAHSLASGGAANVFLTAAARTFGNGDAKDAALTPLTTLIGSPAGTVAVQTSANMTRTSLAATNFDGAVALAANRLLRLSLCRIPADANDSATVSWFLEASPVLTLSIN